MFFLLSAKTRRKSVFCAIEIFAHFAFLAALFNKGSDDDGGKKQDHDACCHREGDRDANDKGQCADNTSANKGDKAAQHDDAKQYGKKYGGDFVHKAQFIRSGKRRMDGAPLPGSSVRSFCQFLSLLRLVSCLVV